MATIAEIAKHRHMPFPAPELFQEHGFDWQFMRFAEQALYLQTYAHVLREAADAAGLTIPGQTYGHICDARDFPGLRISMGIGAGQIADVTFSVENVDDKLVGNPGLLFTHPNSEDRTTIIKGSPGLLPQVTILYAFPDTAGSWRVRPISLGLKILSWQSSLGAEFILDGFTGINYSLITKDPTDEKSVLLAQVGHPQVRIEPDQLTRGMLCALSRRLTGSGRIGTDIFERQFQPDVLTDPRKAINQFMGMFVDFTQKLYQLNLQPRFK